MQKRLTRSADKKLFGVAGGIGNYFDLDPTLVRVGFVVLCFAFFPLVAITYVVLAFVLPMEGADDAPATTKVSETLERARSYRPLVAWVLVGLGVLVLVSELNLLSGLGWVAVPVLLIGAGLFMLTRQSQAG